MSTGFLIEWSDPKAPIGSQLRCITLHRTYDDMLQFARINTLSYRLNDFYQYVSITPKNEWAFRYSIQPTKWKHKGFIYIYHRLGTIIEKEPSYKEGWKGWLLDLWRGPPCAENIFQSNPFQ